MRHWRHFILPMSAALVAVSAYGQNVVDCAHRSLASAISTGDAQKTIRFTGICSGPILISTDGLSLTGVGTAIIDGGKQDAVTVAGVHAVSLSNIEVRNGLNGIIGT